MSDVQCKRDMYSYELSFTLLLLIKKHSKVSKSIHGLTVKSRLQRIICCRRLTIFSLICLNLRKWGYDDSLWSKENLFIPTLKDQAANLLFMQLPTFSFSCTISGVEVGELVSQILVKYRCHSMLETSGPANLCCLFNDC